MTRDAQKSKAIRAQNEFSAPDAKTFASLDAAQAHLDARVRRSRWFRKRWPEIAATGVVVKPVYTRAADFEKVQLKRNGSNVELFPIVYLPTFDGSLFDATTTSWTELLLWHLVAHHCVRTTAHSRAWARAWLALVRRNMGSAAARRLRKLFAKHKLHYLTRALTDEQREAARKRFVRNVHKVEP